MQILSRLIKRIFKPTSFMGANSLENPLLVISGCTGTGKSELAIAIAKAFDGEVINADSMQLYKGLDISTNKLTKAEMAGIPHHLIGYLEPTKSKNNVHNFKKDAMQVIQRIWNDGKLPIVVGGTAYYIEALIYRENLIEHEEDTGEIRERIIEEFPTPELLYQELQRVDPETADVLHRNSTFKVIRALEIFHCTGKTRSEHWRLQNGGKDHRMHFSSQLRFTNTLLLNLDADKEVLAERLFARVDGMMRRGLLEELAQFYGEFHDQLDHGIMQSIGLKEFLPYLRLNDVQKRSEQGAKIFEECVVALKTRNRRYAQRQRNWFYNRILNRGKFREIPKSVALNTGHHFEAKIVPFAIELVGCFLSGKDIDPLIKSSPSLLMPLPPLNEVFSQPNYEELCKKIYYCEVCKREMQGLRTYQQHLRGKQHRKTLMSAKKRKANGNCEDAIVQVASP